MLCSAPAAVLSIPAAGLREQERGAKRQDLRGPAPGWGRSPGPQQLSSPQPRAWAPCVARGRQLFSKEPPHLVHRALNG